MGIESSCAPGTFLRVIQSVTRLSSCVNRFVLGFFRTVRATPRSVKLSMREKILGSIQIVDRKEGRKENECLAENIFIFMEI